jgi:hypothetical protein
MPGSFSVGSHVEGPPKKSWHRVTRIYVSKIASVQKGREPGCHLISLKLTLYSGREKWNIPKTVWLTPVDDFAAHEILVGKLQIHRIRSRRVPSLQEH